MGVYLARSAPDRRDHDATATRFASRSGPALLRRLSVADRPAIETHLLALEAVGRHSRFHALLGDAAIRDYAGRIDFDRMILVGALDPASGAIVGLAEAHLDAAATPRSAEVSVSVLRSHRGQCVGRRLVARALDLAAGRGAQGVEFHYQPGNRAIARLIRAIGTATKRAPGYASISLPLAPQSVH